MIPNRCRIVPELKNQGIMNYLELIESRWRIIFKMEKMMVSVLSVLDSRQNIERIP